MKSEAAPPPIRKGLEVTKITRPRPPIRRFQRSAVITRSNNPTTSVPHNQLVPEEKQQQEEQPLVKAVEVKKDVKPTKLPDYLTLIFNLIWFPFDCIIKIYRGLCFVISLPRKAFDWVKYLATRPVVYAEKAAQGVSNVTTQVFIWITNNVEGTVTKNERVFL